MTTLFDSMNSTVERAVRILKDVKLGGLSARHREHIYVETYKNGREKGFAVNAGDLKLAFAENRNSDCIVVYVGTWKDFDMAGNVPNDEVYEADKTFFSATKGERAAEKAAAKFIQKKVVQATREYLKRLDKVSGRETA